LIIDFHAHITAPEIIARRDDHLVRDAWFRDLYANPWVRLSTAGDLIAAMDRAGVDHALVFGFGWRDMDLCRWEKDYIMEAVDRLIPSYVFLGATLAFLEVSDPVLPTWGKLIVEALDYGAHAGH
jgi:hypothetical protein